ncbi:hypothetical protein A1QC_03225 [Vibrio rumoiensis 1S-45]|uniref:Diguanylate cyclase n=2 Tax=Vibrio rumoiensis TaxID=76258 RepID=A0A1E5E6I5_9VIBR|nr:hypothetical protein A1QC_03225 [Vibrio rumoiensis 1S-45]
MLFSFGSLVSWADDAPQQSNVLILHSYHQGFAWTDELQDGLDQTLPKNIALNVHYLDSKHFQSLEYKDRLYHLYKTVFKNRTYDAIVVSDNRALELLNRLRPEIDRTPIFYTGIDSFQENEYQHLNMTGVYSPITAEKAIELIKQTQPSVKYIYVVTDYSNTGVQARESTHKLILKRYNDGVSAGQPKIVSLIPDDERSELHDLANLPPNSAIFYWTYFRNKAGQVNDIVSMKSLLKVANAPVYIDFDLNTDAENELKYTQGRELGELVAQYLQKPEQELPTPIELPSILKIDHGMVQKWNLKPAPGVFVFNEPKPLWVGHKNEIVMFFIYSGVFGVIILFMLKHLKRVRLSEKQSRQSQYLLETIYDVSHQNMGILDSEGRLLSSNQRLQELVYDPSFNREDPIWDYSGWAESGRKKMEQGFIEVRQKGIVRFEGEVNHSNIGPAVFDITLKQLPDFIGDGEQYLLEAKDITARKSTESRLIESESNFRNYYDLQPMMMVTLDKHNSIQSVNKFTSELLGYEAIEMLGHKLKEFYADNNELSARQVLLKPQKGHALVWRRDVRYITSDKRIVWIRENIRQILDSKELFIVGEDISESHLLAAKLDYQAHHDTLTGLYNRNHFEQELIVALQEVKGNLRSHVMYYLDLDQFKLINDTVGHEAGDAAIVYSGDILSKLMPPNSVLARIGGDEFAILLRDCDDAEIDTFAQMILKTLNNGQFTWRGIHLNINCSIGIRVIDYTAKSPQMVHAQADTACNLAKEEGRNRSHLYRIDDEHVRHREMEMECVNQVYDALAHDRIDLYAQQILDISDNPNGKMHFEILVRLRDQDNKLMSPGIFMPAIERYNLSYLIDRVVFKKTLEWFEQHTENIDKLGRCSINLSGQSMGDRDFIEFLIDLLLNTTVPRDKICIEITETAAVGNMREATHFFTRLKELGCMIALDDFGSGLSSFGYLKTLPLDIVKIDGCFIRDIHTDEMDYILVKSINDLAKQMGKQTVAEFVENEEILSCLKELGIDYAQGYLICAPTPLAELVERLTHSSEIK